MSRLLRFEGIGFGIRAALWWDKGATSVLNSFVDQVDREWFTTTPSPQHADAAAEAAIQNEPWTELESDGGGETVMESLQFTPRKRMSQDRPWNRDAVENENGRQHRNGANSSSNDAKALASLEILKRKNGSKRHREDIDEFRSSGGASEIRNPPRGRPPELGEANLPQSMPGSSTNATSSAPSPPAGRFQAYPSGLSYHAWEVKLRNSSLRSVTVLENLKRQNRADPHLVNENVMKILTDPSVLESAFLSMYLRHGHLSEAEKHFEEVGKSWVSKVAARLETGVYTFPHPSQLEPRNKTKGVQFESVPIWWHKMVPEAMRMVLEAIFEQNFSRLSHGFRRDKGCHSALKEVKQNFGGVDYFLEVDISQCMAGFEKGALMDALRTRIRDDQFLMLVNRAIRAGYLDMSEACYRCIGIPQTTLVSPIMCNIYLHKLDLFMEDLIRCLEVGDENVGGGGSTKARANVVSNRDRWASRRIQPAFCWREWTMAGIKYVRYGGNFLIGINGSSDDAVRVEKDLQWFVRNELALPTKGAYSKIASSSSPDKEYVMFLGAEIYVAPQLSIPGFSAIREENTRLPTTPRMCVPARHLMLKLEECGFTDPVKRRPTFVGRLVHWEAHEIVKYYDVTARMFLAYYQFADNYHCLSLLYDILKQSCALTLGKKLSLKRLHWVTRRFGKDLSIFDSDGKLLAVMPPPKSVEDGADVWSGRDINPYARIERPLKPKFPPSTARVVTGDEAREFTLKARQLKIS
ncbi:hypothetical protein BSKO_12127 [Bryopsis sp. KO-2023]|nr:hypothetical protein BSKO_12127 [Bryopsis sp. KO-2023]